MPTSKPRAPKAPSIPTTPDQFFSANAQFATPEGARDFAVKAMAHAKAGFEQYASNTTEAADVFTRGYKTAVRELTEANLKLLDTARDTFSSALETVRTVLNAASVSDAMQAQAAFVRERFDANLVQANEMAAIARKVANDTAAPARELFQKSLQGWKQTA